MSEFLVKRLTETAVPPKRSTEGSAGYDMRADESFFLNPGERRLISTGISVAVPLGYYGQLSSRSGLAVERSVEAFSGVIDCDYRGEVKVLLKNLGDEVQHFVQGDRIAQLILIKIAIPPVIVVDTLDSTIRGSGGFGSTGN